MESNIRRPVGLMKRLLGPRPLLHALADQKEDATKAADRMGRESFIVIA